MTKAAEGAEEEHPPVVTSMSRGVDEMVAGSWTRRILYRGEEVEEEDPLAAPLGPVKRAGSWT